MHTIQPKIILSPTPSDKIVEAIGFVGLIILIGLPIFYFSQLPETIPSHFGANGKPDAFSSRGSIWIMPILGLVVYVSLFLLNKYPHLFNYMKPVTAENAEQQYSMTTRLIRFTNCAMVWLFVYITYGTIQIALSKQESLSSVAVLIFCLLIVASVIYYVYQSRKKA